MQIDNISTINSTQRYTPIIGEKSGASVNDNVNNRSKKQVKTAEKEKYQENEIIDAIESANKKFVAYGSKFEFSIHEKTKQIMVKVRDVNANEVVREIPPEKILDLVAAIWEISGIIVDEKI